MEHERDPATGSQLKFTDRLRSDGKQKIESTKQTAAQHIEGIAEALDRAREVLEQREPAIASYASQLANRVGNLATRLREASTDDLLEDTRQLARRNPMMYLAGGVAVGFVLARFLKASSAKTRGEQEPIASGTTTEPPIVTEEVVPASSQGG
ncbi:MAG TPA: hypothetical protein VF161_12445 [Steroidobacteraceae bacterium]|jgi:uncharacterized membrane-anchored protein YhcB (DUF1043 family)